jgi:hypothetical protein
MKNRFKDYEHVFRMAGLFAVGTASFFILRAWMVPADFGVYGHYRAGALADNAAYPLKYAGRAACLDCHSDIEEIRRGGKHAGIGCEACHGPLAGHATEMNPEKPTLPDPRETCLRCHAARPSKPHGFPQVDVEEHAPAGACTDCHVAHNPAIS